MYASISFSLFSISAAAVLMLFEPLPLLLQLLALVELTKASAVKAAIVIEKAEVACFVWRSVVTMTALNL